jgi:hypothetical protein
MLLNEYLNRFRKGIQKIENYGYADSIDIREEIRQDRTGRLIFRYDNAAHRPVLGFNEHKHSSDGTIYEAALPDIFDFVDELISHL